MTAIDTNVLVRLITRDDERQAAAAESFIAQGAWVSVLALAETTWVLSTAYEFGPRQVGTAIQMLFDHPAIVLENRETAEAALALFRARPAVGFSDCLMLHLAKRAGHLPLGAFDRNLSKVEGARKL